jgi:hypothetical protein
LACLKEGGSREPYEALRVYEVCRPNPQAGRAEVGLCWPSRHCAEWDATFGRGRALVLEVVLDLTFDNLIVDFFQNGSYCRQVLSERLNSHEPCRFADST